MRHELGFKVSTKYNIKVFDQSKNKINEIEKEGDLVLDNYLNLLSMQCGSMSTSRLGLIDEGGVERLRELYAWHYEMGYSRGVNYIEIGTGTTPPSPSDYALASFLARSGMLAASVTRIAVGKHEITLSYMFSFDVETIVTEVGIAGFDRTYYYLMIRDLLDPPVTVPAGGFIGVKYVITITMSR